MVLKGHFEKIFHLSRSVLELYLVPPKPCFYKAKKHLQIADFFFANSVEFCGPQSPPGEIPWYVNSGLWERFEHCSDEIREKRFCCWEKMQK
jgi:hypothetical protein